MTNQNKEKNKDYFESKERKLEVNEWRKIVNFVIAGIALYLLLTYDVFDYTGNILGVLLVLVVGQILNLTIKRIFSLFMD